MDPLNLPTESPQDMESEWLGSFVRLRSELRFEIRAHGGKSSYVVEDLLRGKFFQIGHLNTISSRN